MKLTPLKASPIEEITDEISEDVELTEETVDFDLRDAIIYSTILEQKYK
jgi:hypothetical protein